MHLARLDGDMKQPDNLPNRSWLSLSWRDRPEEWREGAEDHDDLDPCTLWGKSSWRSIRWLPTTANNAWQIHTLSPPFHCLACRLHSLPIHYLFDSHAITRRYDYLGSFEPGSCFCQFWVFKSMEEPWWDEWALIGNRTERVRKDTMLGYNTPICCHLLHVGYSAGPEIRCHEKRRYVRTGRQARC